MTDIAMIHTDPRPIQSIWYAGDDGGGYSIDPRWDNSTGKIVAYGENGQCAPVPYYAVYDLAGNIKARVPAQMVTVVYVPADSTTSSVPVEPVAPSAIDDLTLPVVGTLYVSRGCATARAVRGVENGPDEYSNLVRITDVAAALEPFRQARHHREEQDSRGAAPTHRHKKRGTEYVLIGIGKMQSEMWEERGEGTIERPGAFESVDMREVAIYRSVDDGSLWVRPREEFEDGRFEAIATTRSGSATTSMVGGMGLR